MRLIDADALNQDFDRRGWDGVQTVVDMQPTIEAEPVKHGRWIEGRSLEKCSVCGKKGFPDWHYCPNCGAKMDG